MRAVAYCRVSTNKEEQLDSLESQQNFFRDYGKKHSYELVHIYADEGKSGTKMKNRIQLQKLLMDGKERKFDLVLIKDVSRLARNTVDFLTSIRQLKSYGIKVVFVNYDQTSSDSSEFMLTMLSAIAQEESANISKRIKFGKKQNAERGKVPNLCYGYDKENGEYFNLHINQEEAEVVRKIFKMYTEEKFGSNRIAKELNQKNIRTKRNCKWTQNAIVRILSNEIYTGKIVNGKEEVVDFLTGERKKLEEKNWMVVYRPELQIITEETYEIANNLLKKRKKSFRISGERETDKYVFSKLIRCKHCGYTFRRILRTYKNTYIRWVCNGRNSNGTETCPNQTAIDEEEMLDNIREYFINILHKDPKYFSHMVQDFCKKYRRQDKGLQQKKDYYEQLNKLKRLKDKYILMYNEDIITIDELKEQTMNLQEDIHYLSRELEMLKKNGSKVYLIEEAAPKIFKSMESLISMEEFTGKVLRRIINEIVVEDYGKVDVYIRNFTD